MVNMDQWYRGFGSLTRYSNPASGIRLVAEYYVFTPKSVAPPRIAEAHVAPDPAQSGSFRRRLLSILPSGQGRSSPRKLRLDSAFSPVEGVPPRSSNLDFGCHSENAGVSRTQAQRSNYQPRHSINMSYIQNFEAELLAKLNSNEETATVVRWIAEKVLESYRNGITAGQKGVQVKRKGQSRYRSSFGKAK